MKKILSFVLIISTVSFGFSQNKKSDHKVGLKAGLAMSKISGLPEGFTAEFKPGFTVAATYEYSIMPFLGIEPGVAFSMLGTKYSSEYGDGSININYLEIPIGIKYYPIEYVSLDVVPTMGFALSAKSKFGDQPEEDEKEGIETFNFGLGLGVTGYYSGVELGFRYNLGLTDITKAGSNEPNVKNALSGFMIYVGYSLPL